MDNLTHGLFGYAVYAASDKTGWDRKERLGYAAAAVLAAELPDVESVTTFMGQAAYLTWHRGITHSFFFVPVTALLAVGLVRLFNRSIRWKIAYRLALIAAFSHVMLDWFNTWGTGIWEPLDRGRYSLGILPIVDGIILSVFLMAFVIRRRLSVEKTFRGVWVILLLYIASQGIQGAVLAMPLSGEYERVSVSAEFVPTQFRLVAQKGDEFHLYSGSVHSGLKREGTVKNQRHPVVRKALKDPEARALVRFLPAYATEVRETKHTYRVRIFDPRFRMVNPSLLSTEVRVPK